MNCMLVFYEVDTHKPAPVAPIRDLTVKTAQEIIRSGLYANGKVYPVLKPTGTKVRE